MTSYELSRFKIIEEINDTTPYCVIEDIAQSYVLQCDPKLLENKNYFNSMVKKCMDEQCDIVFENDKQSISGFSEEDERKIAIHINVKSSWNIKNLIHAFRHLLDYYATNVPKLPPDVFTIGDKKNENPSAYNASMLYRICKYYDIEVNRKTTIDEMAKYIKYLQNSPETLREKMLDIIKEYSNIELINLLTKEKRLVRSPTTRLITSQKKMDTHKRIEKHKNFEDINVVKISDESMKKTFDKIENKSYLYMNYEVQSHEEAIILAAKIFYVNLTECRNPFKEYIELKQCSNNGLTTSSYIPVDDMEFKKRFLSNPTWFDIRIIWEPKLNFLYSKSQLEEFAVAEGYIKEIKNGQDANILLSTSRMVPTFYSGEHPDLQKKQTVIEMDSSKEINTKLLVSYGIATDKVFTLYKLSELNDCFSMTMSFSNPENRSEQFSIQSINKLVNIIKTILPKKRRNYTGTIDSEVEYICAGLLKTIDEINYINENINEEGKKIMLSCFDPVFKEKLTELFNILINACFYMRGWTVISESYPLSKKSCEINTDNVCSSFKEKRKEKEEQENEVEKSEKSSRRRSKESSDSSEEKTSRRKKNEITVSELDKAINEHSLTELTKAINFLNENKEIESIFKNLPLMLLSKRSDDYVFEKITNPEEGLLIIDRINIIIDNTSIYGCIRLSSSKLLHSIAYYSNICKIEIPYVAENVEQIS